jgi:tripartite-type tricarboxylate transporter receptor subunit TctC
MQKTYVSAYALALLAPVLAAPDARAAAAASAYPAKPIRIIVPFAPQGPNDILARLVGQKLTERWGQQVLVDNRPGGGTVIGTEVAARAAGDGYTLLMVSISTAVNPVLRKSLPYDTLNDFTPVIRLASIPNVLVSHPSVPASSVSGLIRLAKARPGEIAYASGGVGGATHLAGELLSMMGGVRMTHVPYKGAAPATVDLLSGQVSWMFASILPTLPYVKAQRFRALAVSGSSRSPVLPDVPTVGETLPGFEATSWFGLFAPAGTPREIVTRLNGEIARVLATAEVREQLQRQGADPVGDSPEEFAAHFKAEMVKWAKVVRAAGIEAN